ncbi:MAG: FtsW/RodA/SpoVE family cell cycle protein [Phycisphaerae bacterium]
MSNANQTFQPSVGLDGHEPASNGMMTRHGILAVSVALLAIGVVVVSSATASLQRSLVDSLQWEQPLGRQVVFVLCGILVLIFSSRLTPFWLKRPSWHTSVVVLLAALTLVALCLPLIPGVGSDHRGSSRWLRLSAGGFGINIQPSEFAKFSLVLLLAWWLTRPWVNIRSLQFGFFPAMIPLGIFVGLVGLEDLGTAALLALVGGLLVLTAGCRLSHVLTTGLLGVAGLVLLLLKEKYRRDRFTAFWNPEADLDGAGYQAYQSLKTIASGGWTGTGLGTGIQKYGYLPESHTDFIFALICEETGVLGALLVMGLYAALIWLGFRVIREGLTSFERLVAFGLTSMIGWQAFMNMAVVVVIAPTTGISLPLISVGGSGILTYSLVLGVLAGIASRIGCVEQPADVPSGEVIRYGVAHRDNAYQEPSVAQGAYALESENDGYSTEGQTA